MDFKEIKMNEAVNLAMTDTGQDVYMLQQITSDTTIEALTKACGFVMKSAAKKPAKEAPKEKSKAVKKSEVDHGKIVALYTATPPPFSFLDSRRDWLFTADSNQSSAA